MTALLVCLLGMPTRRGVLLGGPAYAIGAGAASPGLAVSVAVHQADKDRRWLTTDYVSMSPEEMGDAVQQCIIGRGQGTTVVMSIIPRRSAAVVSQFYREMKVSHHCFEAALIRAPSPDSARTAPRFASVDDARLEALGLKQGAGLFAGAHGLAVGFDL